MQNNFSTNMHAGIAAVMEEPAPSLPRVNNELPRTRLFEICQNMIRKDLEIFRIQDRMLDLFNDLEFFSQRDDEFSSLDFALELAFGKKMDELDENLIAIVGEIAWNAAFSYRRAKVQGDEKEYMSETAKKITEVIFVSALEVKPPMAVLRCIELFHKNFPTLEIPFVENLSHRMLLSPTEEDYAHNLTGAKRCGADGGRGGGG